MKYVAKIHEGLLQSLVPQAAEDVFSPPGSFEGLARTDGIIQHLIAGRLTFRAANVVPKHDRLHPSTALTLRLLAPADGPETEAHLAALSPAIRAVETSAWVDKLPPQDWATLTFSQTDHYYVLSLDRPDTPTTPFDKEPYNLPPGKVRIFIAKDEEHRDHILEGDFSSLRYQFTEGDTQLINVMLKSFKVAADTFTTKPAETEVFRPLSPDAAVKLVNFYTSARPDLLLRERALQTKLAELQAKSAASQVQTDAVLAEMNKEIADLRNVFGRSERQNMRLTHLQASLEQVKERRRLEDQSVEKQLGEIAADLATYEAPDQPSWAKLAPADADALKILMQHSQQVDAATKRLNALDPSLNL